MSTRSRRSAGSDNGTLNRAVIHFLDVARLKKELQERNLSVAGKKEDLALRLLDAIDGKPTEEQTAVTPPKSAGRGKKVTVKTEVGEVIVKEEVLDEEEIIKKKPTTKRSRKSKEVCSAFAESDDQPELVDTPKASKKLQVKQESVEEEVPPPKKKKKAEDAEESPSTSTAKGVSPKKKRTVEEATAPPPQEPEPLTEDVPLLSLLKKNNITVKTEIVENEDDETPSHSHGTRRAKALKSVQQTTVVECKKFIEDLSGDIYDDDDSHDYVPPEPHHNIESQVDVQEKAKKQKSDEGRSKDKGKRGSFAEVKGFKTEPNHPLRPAVIPVTERWAAKVAQMKKAQEQKETEQMPVALDPKPVSRTHSESKGPKTPRPVITLNPLDDILAKQAKIELQAKRREEEEERLAKEAEKERLNKLMEHRRKQAEEDARRAERLKKLPPGSIKPKPIVEPKLIEQKLHPYAIPQPLPQTTASPATLVKPATSIQTSAKPSQLTHTKSVPTTQQSLPKPGLVIPQRIGSQTIQTVPGPPPPPPKREKTVASIKPPTSMVTSVMTSVLPRPPPPPPKKILKLPGALGPPPPPPPPPPRRPSLAGDAKKEPTEESMKKVAAENDNTFTSSSEEKSAVSAEGEIDPSLVTSVAEALAQAMKQRCELPEGPANNKTAEEADAVTESAVVSVTSPMLPERSEDKEQGAEPAQYEEYDPMSTSDGDADVSGYVPSAVVSRNQTMLEDEEESEESDDEVRGEMEDEEEWDEEDSEEEISTEAVKLSPGSSPQKRAQAGREIEALMQNPRDLLMKANNLVFTNIENLSAIEGPQYVQMPSAEDYEPEEEGKKTPEYHGEPVPSDDEIDFFELGAGIQKPKKKKEIVIEEEKLPSDESIEPDYYNADLHIKGVTDKNWLIAPEIADGLALMWGGVKSTYGIRLPFRDVRNQYTETEGAGGNESQAKQNSKKIVFQIRITEFLTTKHLPFEEVDPHDVRVGFSLRSAPNALGEYPNSWCISSLGKKANNNIFSDFGSTFTVNDVITACIDLEDGNISYWKNDVDLGIVFAKVPLPDGEAIFPHICIKNCSVAVNFGDFKGEDDDHCWRRSDEWRFMTDLGRGDLERSQKSPESKAQCTIIMMVGLPGVGKTTWVREYLRDHPEEYWTLINTESVLAAMKVNGVSRQRAHQGRWDMVMGLIGKSLQRSVLLAARRRRNYILDMTNTSRETRKKRLQLFEEFRRKCVIIMPSDEDILDRQARQARQEGTALMPPEAMLEMKAVISLPAQDQEPFEDIYFIEPSINRVQECIDQINRYNEEARPWFQKKYKRRRSQMIGLGDAIQRDPYMPRKPVQPLTVLPLLKVAVVPLDDPSNSLLSGNSSYGSAPTSASALGFTVVEDRSATRPPVAISIDTSIPPPQISLNPKPLVRVTIEDIPATAVPSPFLRRPSTAGLSLAEEQPDELTEEELRELRDAVKTSNPSGNPMMSEAIMRSRLKALQLKKQEKRAAIHLTPKTEPSVPVPTTPLVALPASTPVTGTPISVLGGRSIPTIGAQRSLSIDTSLLSASTSFPSSSNSNSPHTSLSSPSVVLTLPPAGLAAPYLSNQRPPQQQNGFVQHPMGQQFPMQSPVTMNPPTTYPSFSQPPPGFAGFQTPQNMSVPPPTIYSNNGIPTPTGYPAPPFQWSAPSSGI